MNAQDLARSLTAAGSVKIPDGDGEGLYLLSVRDGDLVEKHWVGDSLQEETVVASEVREDTSASYLLISEQCIRHVVFVDQDNVVQCYAYDEDIEEWEDTPLGAQWNITVHPKGKLSANIGPRGELVVTYQDESGRLAGMMSVADNKWKTFGPFGGSPILGTPQCLEVIDDRLHLFYIEEDAGIGYLVFDSAGNWKANVLKNTNTETTIDNFSVAKDPETSDFQSYFISGGFLWTVNGEKQKIKLGKVTGDGKLIPADGAQAGWWFPWRRPRNYVINYNINFNVGDYGAWEPRKALPYYY
ncbi:hypothetical protein F5Y04DRAFT_99022 [Hypomontagnella monticulosa]|nr:hypothetical protein F5Y04DRAFT_99022 [Hypomontagnella monticulosa]